jgi:hypothetical protein
LQEGKLLFRRIIALPEEQFLKRISKLWLCYRYLIWEGLHDVEGLSRPETLSAWRRAVASNMTHAIIETRKLKSGEKLYQELSANILKEVTQGVRSVLRSTDDLLPMICRSLELSAFHSKMLWRLRLGRESSFLPILDLQFEDVEIAEEVRNLAGESVDEILIRTRKDLKCPSCGCEVFTLKKGTDGESLCICYRCDSEYGYSRLSPQ